MQTGPVRTMLEIEPMPCVRIGRWSLRKASHLGATPCRDGANFSVFSKHATGIVLLLFDDVDDAQPARAIRIDPASNRTGHYWHVFVLASWQARSTAISVEGPWDP